MKDFGTVRPGSTLYIEFDSFGANGESLTLTGLAVTDIEVYKDGSTTQRASDAGYTLLDTDGIDFDSLTGIHGFSINLADNTTAGFWAAGSHYRVVVSAVTINAQTVSFTAATFRIGYPNAVLNTTIATLASQTSFTLTNGPAEDDALNGMWAIIHDVASAVQWSKVLILDYTGSTKTVTLAAGATFTAAASDNFSVMDLAPLQPSTTGRTLVVDTNSNASSVLANVAHGGGSASLRLGSSSSTPALYVTNSGGPAVHFEATSGNNIGLALWGAGTGSGLEARGGSTGVGGYFAGGSTSGSGMEIVSTSGFGLYCYSPDSNAILAYSEDVASAIRGENVGGGVGLSLAGATPIDAVTVEQIRDSVVAIFTDDVGTAQAGGSNTITLRSGAVATDDYYNGAYVTLTGGTGVGQTRKITDYVGSTKVATLDSNWVTNPDNTSTYIILGRAV